MAVGEKIPDGHLVKQVLGGDKTAFKTLYQKYARSFLLVCMRYTRNRQTAEDMLQDAFLAVYKSLPQFDERKGEFSFWSKRVVVNCCLQKLRKKSVLDKFEELVEVSNEPLITSDAIDNLSLQELTQVIQALPSGYRRISVSYTHLTLPTTPYV